MDFDLNGILDSMGVRDISSGLGLKWIRLHQSQQITSLGHILQDWERFRQQKLKRKIFIRYITYHMGFPGGSVVKNLPTMQETQETQVWSLGWEDLLEKETATHSSILAWRIPWTEEPISPQSMGSQRVGHGRTTFTFTADSLCCTTESNTTL